MTRNETMKGTKTNKYPLFKLDRAFWYLLLNPFPIVIVMWLRWSARMLCKLLLNVAFLLLIFSICNPSFTDTLLTASKTIRSNLFVYGKCLLF